MFLTPRKITTDRLVQNVWTAGPEDGTPVLLVHGNLSTGAFWEYVAAELPDGVRVIAPDLRGFGATQTLPVNASLGLGDFVEDLHELLHALRLNGHRRVHTVGWSMGAGVLQQYLLTHPEDVASLTFVAPLSPFGFGGTVGNDGRTTVPDHAGTGGGGANPDFVARLEAGDRSSDDASSPRVVFTSFFGPGPNAGNVDEDFLVDQILLTATGHGNYPGDSAPSQNWPGFAPGDNGVLNTMSPKHFDSTGMVSIARKPPITWIHGGKDQVVSDNSLFDLATLGKMGAIPGWPGEATMASQPMVGQMRSILAEYRDRGGITREVFLEEATHGIPLEVPQIVAAEISNLMGE